LPPEYRKSIIQVIFSRRMLVALIMGYVAGLPLELTSFVLKTWLREDGVDLTTIGVFALVGLPYTLKFIAAPVLDRFAIPLFGRRRGWLLIFQTGLMISVFSLGTTNPGQNPTLVACFALLVAFFSASQDTVIDAYRREDLADEELGLGSSLYVSGYRVGMLLATGGGLILADHMPFSMVYAIMAACLLPGLITTLMTPEPTIPFGTPRSMG
jgi:PAT family beta-lactamase induction signal transducer AmpG